jgi:DNA-binding HxlR family transcriptional regulator
MVALDLLGRRWTLRLLWELRDGPLTFRGIQGACEQVSPTVLNTRLRELRENGLVEATDRGYALTQQGRRLRRSLVPLYNWAQDWGPG